MLTDNDVMFAGIDVISMSRVEFDIVLYTMVVAYATELLHLQTWEQYDGSGGVAETGTELLDIDGDIVVDVIVTLTVNCVLFSIEYDGVIIHVLEVSTTLPYENDMKEINIHICMVLDTCETFEFFVTSIFADLLLQRKKPPDFSPIQRKLRIDSKTALFQQRGTISTT